MFFRVSGFAIVGLLPDNRFERETDMKMPERRSYPPLKPQTDILGLHHVSLLGAACESAAERKQRIGKVEAGVSLHLMRRCITLATMKHASFSIECCNDQSVGEANLWNCPGEC